MVCIYCHGSTQVINSRPQKRLNQIWRRRRCTDCAAIFTTEEAADYGSTWRVRSADGLEPFHTQRLFISLYKSLEHRQTALWDAEGLTNTIISQLSTQTDKAVLQSAQIAHTAYTALSAFDTAAGVHYQAFHPGAES